MKFRSRLIAKIAVLSLSLVLAAAPNAAASMDSSYQDVLSKSSIVISKDGKVVMAVQKDINYLVAGNIPGELRLPVVFANISGENGLTISKLAIRAENTGYQSENKTGIILPGMTGENKTSISGIALGTNRFTISQIKELAKMSVESFSIPPGITKGSPQNFIITATVSNADGSESTIESKFNLTFRSLPQRSGWYCGDGHMHTSWSDGIYSLEERMTYFKNAGMGWAVITDHEKLLKNCFPEYCRAVAECAQATGLPLAPGMEIIAAGEKGHALAYGLSNGDVSADLPADNQYTGQELLNHINTTNSPSSLAVIAHPFSSTVWRDLKTTRNFSAMELASGGAINEKAFAEWMERLRSGEKITALGNSDCHIGYPDGLTYLFIPDYSAADFSPVWKAIRTGRAVVSEKGSLAAMAINGQAIGSTVSAAPQSPLTFTLIQQVCSGVACSKIEVLDENGQVVYQAANPPEKTTLEKPAQSKFYLLRAYFSDGSKVISNPIFVQPY